MIQIPGPRAHLRGTLQLIDCFSRLCGGHPRFDQVQALLDHPRLLPAELPAERMALKYDAYFTRSAQRRAWGIAVNDRWEGDALAERVQALAAEWGVSLDAYFALRRALGEQAAPVLTAAFGFDAPDREPRLKLYLQEDPWDAGVCTPQSLAPLLEEIAPGCRLPAWLPADRKIGVVTLELHAGGARSLKAYVGAASPQDATLGAPPEVRALAVQMAEVCPQDEGWYYLTIRMAPDTPQRYAINKIYNLVQMGFRDGGVALEDAWRDITALFESAARGTAMVELREALAGLPQLRVVPTASALEDGGRSADLYCAAWDMGAR